MNSSKDTISKSNDKNNNNSVTLLMKINALNKLQKGASKSDIASEYGVNARTVSNWIKNEKKIREWQTVQNNISPEARKRIRQPQNQMLDDLLWFWFEQRHKAGYQFNGPLLQEQALSFWEKLGEIDKFTASRGWLEKWQKRHSIRGIKINGEKLSGDYLAAEKYREEFTKMVEKENLTVEQMFNADETGINFRQLPKSTLSSRSEAAVLDLEMQKERLTVMACSNVSGTCKLPLMVINKSKCPLNYDKSLNELIYCRSQSSAWMNSHLFEEWFHCEFVPKVRAFLQSKNLPMKAILFVNNCAAHSKKLSDGDIHVEFLPKHTTSLIQPMDQGVLQNLKLLYRKQLMSFILEKIDGGNNLNQAVKSFNLANVVVWLANAWDRVLPTTILKSWEPLWPVGVNNILLCKQEATEIFVDTSQLESEILIQNFHNVLQNEYCYNSLELNSVEEWLDPPTLLTEIELLNEDEIFHVVTSIHNDSSIPKEPSIVKNKINLSDVQNSIDKVIQYCSTSPHYTKKHLDELNDVRNAILVESLMSKPDIEQ